MTAAMPLRRYRIDGLDRFRRALLRRVGLLMAAVILTATPATLSKGDHVLEVDSRGQKIRALLLEPENPVGSVILLAGGHGRLDLAADGRIALGVDKRVKRLHQMPCGAVEARLVAGVHVLGRSPAPFFAGGDELELDDPLGSE